MYLMRIIYFIINKYPSEMTLFKLYSNEWKTNTMCNIDLTC